MDEHAIMHGYAWSARARDDPKWLSGRAHVERRGQARAHSIHLYKLVKLPVRKRSLRRYAADFVRWMSPISGAEVPRLYAYAASRLARRLRSVRLRMPA